MSSEVFNSTSILETSKVLRLVDTGIEKLVDTGNSRLTHLAAPKDAKDAVNKEYLEQSFEEAKEAFESIKTQTLAIKDEAIEQTNTIKTATNQIKTQTEQIKTETNAIKTQTQQIKTETNAIKSEAQQIKTQTEQIKSQTQQIKSETQQIKLELIAKAQNLSELIEALEQIKQSSGVRVDEIIQSLILDDKEFLARAMEELLKRAEYSHKVEEIRQLSQAISAKLEELKYGILDFADIVEDRLSSAGESLIKKSDEIKLEATRAKHEIVSKKEEVINLVESELGRASDYFAREFKSANIHKMELDERSTIARDLINELKGDELCDELYLVRGESALGRAKVASELLGLSIATGAAKAIGLRYERQIPKLVALQDETKEIKEQAQNRLDELNILLEASNTAAASKLKELDELTLEAHKMIKNSEFANLLGVIL
jgi:predicted RND superfamily exporter protein